MKWQAAIGGLTDDPPVVPILGGTCAQPCFINKLSLTFGCLQVLTWLLALSLVLSLSIIGRLDATKSISATAFKPRLS